MVSENFKEQIKNFFKKNDYYVRVFTSPDKKNCIAEFPERTAIKPWIDGKTCLYSIEGDGILYFRSGFPSSKGDLDLVEEKSLHLDCPAYSRRIIIFNDILKSTLAIGLPISLILFCDSNGEEIPDVGGFVDILTPPETEEDILLEEKLAEVYYMNLSDSADYSDLAEKNKVEHGYRLLKDSFV
jgi:hypothetical protein